MPRGCGSLGDAIEAVDAGERVAVLRRSGHRTGGRETAEDIGIGALHGGCRHRAGSGGDDRSLPVHQCDLDVPARVAHRFLHRQQFLAERFQAALDAHCSHEAAVDHDWHRHADGQWWGAIKGPCHNCLGWLGLVREPAPALLVCRSTAQCQRRQCDAFGGG